jgi:hypothetical protein
MDISEAVAGLLLQGMADFTSVTQSRKILSAHNVRAREAGAWN